MPLRPELAAVLIRARAPQLIIIVQFGLLGALLLFLPLRRRLWQFRGRAMHRFMAVPIRFNSPVARLQERVQEASHDVKLDTGHIVVTGHVAMSPGDGAMAWSVIA